MTSSPTGLRPRQRPSTPARRPFDLPPRLQSYLEQARAALREEFRGITTDGTVVPGLFPLQRTGISTQPIKEAAEAFLASLAPEQRASVLFDVESEAWRAWSNIHPYILRHGLCLESLSPPQRELALALLRTSLSLSGFELARNVMKLNEHIGEITNRWDEYGEWLYWLSLMGTPSLEEPWGWQIDGHHLIINCFILKDQLVLTPNFMGSEPVVAETGKYAGTRVFQAEEAKGLALMRALTPAQREKATIGMETPFDVFATAFRDNLVLRYEGIRYDALTTEQRALLLDLIATYVGRLRPGHAEVRLEEVKRHLAETHFAWIGGYDDVSPFYYRVHSPVILIEFDHQPGIALDNDQPSRNHIHTLVRTPNGNDYGKDLLRQHYEQFHRPPPAPAGQPPSRGGG
ncbi:MAG TPA: DUF3500 domain-containing protein [Chloroflexota bacterium]|nr:DUF3500 domain-containing protein [Chloroflexota bacterium]